MNRIFYWFAFAVALVLVLSGCEEESTGDVVSGTSESTEISDEVITTATNDLSSAIDEILEDKSYELLSLSESETVSATSTSTLSSSGDSLSVDIDLADIAGRYVYSSVPVDTILYPNGTYRLVYKFFSKADDSDDFIVELPEEKALGISKLYSTDIADTALSNNFVITSTEFEYKDYSHSSKYSYLLNSEIDIDEAYAAGIYVSRDYNGSSDVSYESVYAFSSGYSLGLSYDKGDTVNYSFGLYDSDDVLYEESVSYDVSNGWGGVVSSYTYALEIGDIKIERTSESDSIVYNVYVNDVLQEDASVTFTSTSVDNGFRFSKKEVDILITLEDDTEYYLSELVGDAQDTLDTLYDSMDEMYFAKYIVNKLAWKIYTQSSDS